MDDEAAQDWKRRNVTAYSSVAATGEYVQRARDSELRPIEARVISDYFTPPGPVLDLGCGAGRTSDCLADRGYDVVGLDVSAPLVHAADQLLPSIEFQVGDAATLPFGAETFEYVLFSANGLDYLYPEADRLAALEEIYRVLEPGGRFAFSTHNSWYALPALFLARSYLWQLYVGNGNASRLFSPHKLFAREFDTATYISNPYRQRRQLAAAGFDFLAQVGKRRSPVKYVERVPYYVVRKPTV